MINHSYTPVSMLVSLHIRMHDQTCIDGTSPVGYPCGITARQDTYTVDTG
jgi:hypothetical protein